MRYTIDIGARTDAFLLPDTTIVDVLHSNTTIAYGDEIDILKRSIDNPIGVPLSKLVSNAKTVCIIVSDITRPVPTARILPVLMEFLHSYGVSDSNVTLAIALGSHRPQTNEELASIMGEYFGKLKVINGDTRKVVHIGVTKAGTPVDICTEILESDVRISIGNVEYHYFAGYSGGAKAIMPGMSTADAIQANHSLMIDPAAHAGNVNSPVRLDLEEACGMVGLEFIINVVLDESKRIVYSSCGDYIAAHRDACKKLDELYGCPISHRYDLVVASQGGFPKDLNLYQTQKALDNAKHAVRDGGIIVLVGSCKEGFGQAVFEEWLIGHNSPQDIIDSLVQRFSLGAHKAAAMAWVMLRADVYLVSEMPHETVEKCFMTPFENVQSAVDAALDKIGDFGTILVMPHAGSTLPILN